MKFFILHLSLFTLVFLSAIIPAAAQESSSETGLWISSEVQKKLSAQWSLSGEAEYRLRDNFGSTDRWTVALSTAYKPLTWLKLDAGYKLMRVLNPGEAKWKDNGVDMDKRHRPLRCRRRRMGREDQGQQE